jgi:hypothetical protein
MSRYPIDLTGGVPGPRALLLAPDLYLGGATMTMDHAAVIQLAPEVPPKAGPLVLRRLIHDGQPIDPALLDECVRFAQLVARTRTPLLVQCAMGLSRSATVAYAILRVRYGLEHDEAYRRVASRYAGHTYPHPVTFRSAMQWVTKQRGPCDGGAA